MTYRFDAELWIWKAREETGWHFVTLPPDVADEIDEITTGNQRGFGSVRVRATIGASTFATSIFPSKEEASFVLPVKKPVRTAEGVGAGDRVTVELDLVDL